MKKRLAGFIEWVFGHRAVFLIVVAAITGVFVVMSLGLEINNAHDTWLPEHDRVAQLLRQVDDDFSSNVMIFSVIEFEQGVFSPEALTLVARITQELEEIKELFNVTSITNVLDIRSIEGGIEVSDLIPAIPETEQEIEELREYVLSKEHYVNSIVSEDGIYTTIMTNIVQDQDEVKVAEKVFRIIDELAGPYPHYHGGDPAIYFYMNYYMVEDMKVLVPIILVVVVIVLSFGLRRISGVVLPMFMVSLAIVWTLGMMAVLGFPINILTPAVVVLLVALGADYAVHIYNHFLRRGDISVSTSEIALPVGMSALTTIAGLLAFTTTRIEVLNNFGIELAFGLGFACILSITLMGTLIFMLKTKPAVDLDTGKVDTHVFTQVMHALGGWVHDHAKVILAVLGIITVFIGINIVKIRTNVDFIEQLPEDSPPRKGCTILVEHFSGMYPFNFYVRGDLTDPAVMNRMNFLENHLRSEPNVNGFTSISGIIARQNWLLNGIHAIPETREGIANLWFLLEGHSVLKTFVTTDRTKGIVNSVVRESSTNELRFLADRMEAFLHGNTSGRIVTIDPGILGREGRELLGDVRLNEASQQVRWLSEFYDRAGRYDDASFRDALARGLSRLDETIDLAGVWDSVYGYLSEETVEILPEALVLQSIEYLEENWQRRHDPELSAALSDLLADSGVMDREDADITVSGLLKRVDSSYRMAQVDALRGSYDALISESLTQNADFRKRSDGVLWELLSPRPAFFSSQVAAVPNIEHAVVSSSEVKIDQAGMPETVRLIQKILIRSQIQSLAIAILIVFSMVALAYRSMRRGATSMMTVLVPLTCILGFMGMMHIPLDLGTVLCGSLIVGLGIDGSIQFLHHYNTLHLGGMKKRLALQTTMGHVGRAVITANFTTLFGFIVLLMSNTSAVRNFSTVNSVAILLVTISVLTLLPAMVTVLHLDVIDDLEDGQGPQ